MNFELSDEQRALQRTARDFAERELAPHAARWDAERIFPRDTITRAGRLGFCGLCADERHGGQGASRLDATLVFEDLAAACPSTTAYLTIHNMATWMITRWARADVLQRWAQRLTAGGALASYCLTEPGAGSDAASLRSTAKPDGHEYVLRGTKAFVSGAGVTNALVVIARTGGEGADGLSAFLVPADTKGITLGRDEEKLGWHSQPTRTISLDDARVPIDHLLGEEGEGFHIAMKGLDGERINIATCSLGAAFERLATFHGLSVAAINGFAMGGGLECALACDLRIAEEQAVMALPETAVGLLPCAGETQWLSWLVGEGWAKRMVLCGERVDAATALRIGLVEEVAARGQGLTRALELCARAEKQSPTSVAACKRLIQGARTKPPQTVLVAEREAFVDLFDTQDQREGVAAFLAKRQPVWRNA